MAHRYRTLQLWNQWLNQQTLGQHLLNAEQTILSQLLSQHYGNNALLIGVPNQADLLQASSIYLQAILSPLAGNHTKNAIEVDLHELPIVTGGVDLVILPHALEFVDNPRQLLSESCRIIRPEGLLVIIGFNPYSMWGIRKWLMKNKLAPWSANFLPAHKIKSWLNLVDFKLEQQKTVLYRPPVEQQNVYKKLQFVELMGKTFFPTFGGVYVIVARAKVIPLTPIKLKWKQQFRITSLPGHIAR